MRHVVASVDRQLAWAKLTRRSRIATWFDRLRSGRSQPSHIEMLYFPTWLVTYPGAGQGVLVDAATGTARVVVLNAIELAPSEVSTEVTPPWTAVHAIEAAADAILKTRLNLRSQQRAIATSQPHAQLVGYPYWAYYFARSAGMLDAKLLDAVTGERAGPKMKPALIAALADRRPAS